MNALFVCSRNRLRSPTAEAVFAGAPGVSVASAGTSPDAEQQVDAELIEWADLVLVMESRHKRLLTRAHGPALRDKRIVVLGIPDNYGYMDPALVRLLESRAGVLLRS